MFPIPFRSGFFLGNDEHCFSFVWTLDPAFGFGLSVSLPTSSAFKLLLIRLPLRSTRIKSSLNATVTREIALEDGVQKHRVSFPWYQSNPFREWVGR